MFGISPMVRMEVGRQLDSTGFAVDEGRGAILALLVALAAAALLPGLVARLARARRESATAQPVEAAPPTRGQRPTRGRSRGAPEPSATVAAPRGWSSRSGAASAPGAGDGAGVVRCPRCYGKYDATRNAGCPYCADERERQEELSGQYPQVELADQPGPNSGSRFGEAERLNADGVDMLQNMRAVFRVDDAVKQFSRAIDLAPRNPSYYSNRAVAHFTNANRQLARTGDRTDPVLERDLSLARADLDHALELRGRHANFLVLQAQIEEFAGDADASRRLYREAQAVEPEHPDVVEALARLDRQGEDDAERRAKAEHLMAIAEELAREGQTDEAMQRMEEAGEADPSWAAPLYGLAEILDRAGHSDESVVVARRAIEVAGRDVEHLLETVRAQSVRFRTGLGSEDAQELSISGAGVGPGGSALTGALSEFGLPDLLQVLASGQKTVRVELTNDGRAGSIDLEAGQIVHATLDERIGEEALYELVCWSDGEFRVDPRATPDARTISGSNESHLLEGLRRLDERRAAAGSHGGET